MILKLNGSTKVNYFFIVIVRGVFFEFLNLTSKKVLLNANANCMSKNECKIKDLVQFCVFQNTEGCKRLGESFASLRVSLLKKGD